MLIAIYLYGMKTPDSPYLIMTLYQHLILDITSGLEIPPTTKKRNKSDDDASLTRRKRNKLLKDLSTDHSNLYSGIITGNRRRG